MSLTKTVVARPTTLIIFFALLVGLGLYATLNLAIDLYPEIEPPVMMVFSNYSGAGPQEVEKSLTRPLEGALVNVGNIDKLTSISSEGSSQIMIEFTWGTDMSEAANDVRDKLEFISEFMPQDATSPQIFKFDPAMIPIMFLILTGPRSPEELRAIGEEIVQPRIEQVEGVALAGVMGGRERAIRAEVSQNRLEAYGLTLTQVAAMLGGQNVQISAGSITEGSKNYLIRTAGEYTDIDQIKNTVVAYKGAAPAPGVPPDATTNVVLLRDIANVFDGYTDEQEAVFINGQPGVYVIVQKQSGTNSVQVADNIIKRLEQINQEVPAGVGVEVIIDTTGIIRTSLKQVSSTAVSGAILAVLILLIFLRSIRSTIIVGLSIPVSIIVTMMLMYFFDLTLNIMTLSGLALGIGMLVDNSIVILENIYRYREKGAKLTASAILGSQEMINAIMASTLTTICVFAPLIMFRNELGLTGELFSGLAFTVVISLSASLLVAILLVPVLASRYLPIRSKVQHPLTGLAKRLDDSLETMFTGLEAGYKRMLAFVLRHRLATVLVIVGIFVASLFLIPVAGFELTPEMEHDSVQLNVELPIGTKLEITKATMSQIEDLVKREIVGYDEIVVSSGERGFFGFLGSNQSHKGSIIITQPPWAKRVDTSTTIQEKLRTHFNDFPSAVFSFQKEGGLGGQAQPVDILVKTEDLDLGRDTAYRIRDLLEENLPAATEPTVSFKEGLPEIEVIVDRDKASSLGLNIYTIGQEIRANVAGTTATRFREGGSEYDVIVVLDPEDRDALPDLQRIFVINNAGSRIPVSSFAHIERTTGPVDITRENQTRTIHVTAGMAPGTKLNELGAEIRKLVSREIPATDDLLIAYSGDFEEMLDSFSKLGIIVLIAIALVFGVMAAQFESFLDPFIIFFTIPLTLIGVIWLYVATGERFSLFTAVGVVMLVGIVVNNGIVLVDYTNLLRKRGRRIVEACVEAGGNRLRPILMTTLTTILGLIPLSFVRGEGADLVQPIGKTVVGGLAVSTILTLFLVPVIYARFNEMAEKRAIRRDARRRRRREQHTEQGVEA